MPWLSKYTNNKDKNYINDFIFTPKCCSILHLCQIVHYMISYGLVVQAQNSSTSGFGVNIGCLDSISTINKDKNYIDYFDFMFMTEFAQPYIHMDVWSVLCQLCTSSGFTWFFLHKTTKHSRETSRKHHHEHKMMRHSRETKSSLVAWEAQMMRCVKLVLRQQRYISLGHQMNSMMLLVECLLLLDPAHTTSQNILHQQSPMILMAEKVSMDHSRSFTTHCETLILLGVYLFYSTAIEGLTTSKPKATAAVQQQQPKAYSTPPWGMIALANKNLYSGNTETGMVIATIREGDLSEDMILPEVTTGDAHLRLLPPPSFSQGTLLVI